MESPRFSDNPLATGYVCSMCEDCPCKCTDVEKLAYEIQNNIDMGACLPKPIRPGLCCPVCYHYGSVVSIDFNSGKESSFCYACELYYHECILENIYKVKNRDGYFIALLSANNCKYCNPEIITNANKNRC
jgi:hypothetical protein